MRNIVQILFFNILSLFFLIGCGWLARDIWEKGGKEKYAEFFPTKIHLAENLDKAIGLKDPIVLFFSVAVDGEKYVKETRLEPFKKAKIKYDGQAKKLSVIPIENWDPETEYKLILPEATNKYWAKVAEQEIKFNTLPFPRVEKIFPLDNAEDILLDMESPIQIKLEEPNNDFSLKFTIAPSVELVEQLSEDQKTYKLLPTKPLLSATQYTLEIFAFLKNDPEKNRLIFESHFNTLPDKPVSWEKDLNLRVAQAKKYTRAKIFTGKYIDINLENQVMVIFQEGKALEAFPISSGKRGMETPKGEHQVYNKAERVWSKKYGLYMPYWMAIIADGSVGIHELPEWPGGFKEGAFHLGIPVSHGCVRLGVGAAKTVFDWAEIGTPVIVY